MSKSRLPGIVLITTGASLLAAVLYEPANVVSMFGLENLLSEASAVLLSFAAVGACSIGGLAALRSGARAVD
jgi:hypothetical protein